MSIKASTGKRDFEIVPAGSHVARIYQIIDIGTEEGFQGAMQHKIRITFELPNKTKVFREGEGEKPFAIGQDFTLSMNEKANLRQFVESLQGGMNDDEASEFDIETLLGSPCLINVVHKKSARTGNDYATIAGAVPLPEGLTCPVAVNKPMKLSYDDFDYVALAELNVWLQDRITATDEFKQLPDSKNIKI